MLYSLKSVQFIYCIRKTFAKNLFTNTGLGKMCMKPHKELAHLFVLIPLRPTIFLKGRWRGKRDKPMIYMYRYVLYDPDPYHQATCSQNL